jgi:hypothetical protein
LWPSSSSAAFRQRKRRVLNTWFLLGLSWSSKCLSETLPHLQCMHLYTHRCTPMCIPRTHTPVHICTLLCALVHARAVLHTPMHSPAHTRANSCTRLCTHAHVQQDEHVALSVCAGSEDIHLAVLGQEEKWGLADLQPLALLTCWCHAPHPPTCSSTCNAVLIFTS